MIQEQRTLPILPLLLLVSLLTLILGWVSTLPMRANYVNLVQQSAYLEDPNGTYNQETVQSQSFTPFVGPLFRGNNSDPVWLRITIAPSHKSDWVLMIQPNFTQHVDIWLPQETGGYRQVQLGNQHAFSSREVETLTPVVKVKPNAESTTVLYARVVTPTTPIYARVISEQDNVAFDSLMHMVGGVLGGIGTLLFMASLAAFFATRDSLWFFDSLHNFTGLTVFLIQMGLLSRYAFPDSENWVNHLGPVVNALHLTTTALLTCRISLLFALPSWLLWPMKVTPLLLPVFFAFIESGHTDIALRIVNLLIFFLTASATFNSFVASHADRFQIVVLRVAYTGLLLHILWWAIPILLQLQNDNYATLYSNTPMALFNMFMTLLILARNTQLKIQESYRLEAEKREAEQELKLARQRHEETSSFYSMLLHEVKNPLSTIRMAVSNLENSLADQDESVQRRLMKVQSSVDDVDEVLKRGVDVDILEQGALIPEMQDINVVHLVKELCNSHPCMHRLNLSATELLIARADYQLVSLMLTNLIDNAIKYSPEDSVITVNLHEANQSNWILEVSNLAGVAGFPDESKIFSKYYRSPLAARKSGMGLGLYWVRGVARSMGGDVYYSRHREWVKFKLCLPI